MPMPAPARPSRLWTQLLLVLLASVALAVFVQSGTRGIYGYDGYFHIRYSEWIRAHGLGDRFPWWQETFLRDRWADKELLYHLLLMPFTFGDLESGGRAASILLASLLFVALFLAIDRLGTPHAWAWTAGCAVSSVTLLYRVGLLRAIVPAAAIALLGATAILKRRRAGIGIAAGLYALTHIAWQLLPGIAVIHDVTAGLRRRRPVWEATPAAVAGTLCGVILNPGFPANLKLWYVQNVSVLSLSWSGAAERLGMANELRSLPSLRLLRDNPGPFVFTAIGIVALLSALRRDARRPSTGTLTLGMVTLGLLALSFKSLRFIELWAPFSALFAAVAVGERTIPGRGVRRLAAGSFLVAFAIIGMLIVPRARAIIAGDSGRLFDVCATWIRDNVPAGATVFTTDWDEFPELFYVAPRQHYLVGLDPTFMYVTDPDRWRLWRDIIEGRAADITDPIRDVFHSRYVFADAWWETFVERADQDPMLRPMAASPDCTVYAVRDEDPAGLWAATPVVSWRTGPDSEPRVRGPHDFVDVGEVAGESRTDDHDCMTLTGRFVSDRAGRMRLAVSTDDPIEVELGGITAYDSRLASPPSLDQAIAPGVSGSRRRYARTFEAPVGAGYNELRVTTCRSGRVWGFHLGGALLP